MESIRTNVDQVCADFRSIKEKIIANGVEVADGTPTSEYAGKVDEVREAGRQSQYDEFWDTYQENGNRADYGTAFGVGWSDSNFKPQYDIVPTKTAGSLFVNSKITDLKAILESQGVKLDLSNCVSCNHLFQFAKIMKVGVLDLTSNLNTNTVIGENYSVTDIDKIVLKDDGTQPKGSGWFWGAFFLKNITIEGKIGQSCHFSQSSQLTYESLMSIINALYDYSGTGETKTLTLHPTAKARLSDADIAIGTQKGWTIA